MLLLEMQFNLVDLLVSKQEILHLEVQGKLIFQLVKVSMHKVHQSLSLRVVQLRAPGVVLFFNQDQVHKVCLVKYRSILLILLYKLVPYLSIQANLLESPQE